MTEQEFLDDMRTYEKDHEPDGWPAVQMKKVTHLLDIIDRQNAEIRRLQDLIKIPDPPSENGMEEFILTIEQGPYYWLTFNISPRQLTHLKMLCKFHLTLSYNEKAKDSTSRILTCLEKWPKPYKKELNEETK